MTFLRFAAIVFLLLILLVSFLLTGLFRLKKKGGNLADIAFPLYAIAFYLISDKAFYHSLLPQLCLVLSVLALVIAGGMLYKGRDFSYKRFLKLFWRAGFLVTFFCYLALTISLFL